METKSQSIAKNTTWLTSAYIWQKIFAFIYFTIIARILGANDIGLFVFAISLTTILSVFIDFGLSPVLIRECSKYKEKANNYLNNVITIKLLFSVITFILAIIIINLLNKPVMVQIMVYLAAFVMIFDSFTLSFWGIFRAWQNLKFEAISITINQVFIVVVGLAGIFLKFPLYILVIALLAGSIFSFIYSLSLIKFKLKFKLKLVWQKDTLKKLFIIALPFALAGIFTRVYSYIDQVLLSVLIGDQALGWYSVAYKMTYALQFIPAAFAASLFPAMSHSYHEQKEKLKMIFEQSMFILIIIAVPIAFGVLTLADKFIIFLYTSQYQPSILSLQIFIFATLAIFISYPVGSILNACNKQSINTLNMGITMVVNIILNIILIPIYQHIGASIAALASLSLLVILNLFWVPTIVKYDYKFLLIKFFKALVASIIMAGIILYLKPYLNFIILIVIGATIYCLIIFLIKGITINNAKYLWKAILKKEV